MLFFIYAIIGMQVTTPLNIHNHRNKKSFFKSFRVSFHLKFPSNLLTINRYTLLNIQSFSNLTHVRTRFLEISNSIQTQPFIDIITFNRFSDLCFFFFGKQIIQNKKLARKVLYLVKFGVTIYIFSSLRRILLFLPYID